MSRRNFKHFIDGYLEYTADLEATDRINTFAAISGIASALERKVFIPMSYGALFPNSYVYIVGPPGKTRKSSSTNMMVKLLKQLPEFKVMANKITAASMLDEIEKAQKSVVIDGENYNHCSILLYASELKNTFNTLGGTIAEQLTDIYDSNPDFLKATKHSGNNYIYNPCLNFLACTTVDWLLDHIGIDEVEGGLASRIIFVVENGEPKNLVALPTLTPKMKKVGNMLLEDLNQIYNLSGQFQMTASATEFYTKWYNQHRNVDMHKRGVFKAFMARKDVHVLKLAMIDAAARGNDLIITPTSFEWAVSMLNKIEPDIEKAFITGRNDQYRTSCQVLEDINRAGKISHHKLLDAVNRQVKGRIFQEIINDLIDRHRIDKRIEGGITYYIPRKDRASLNKQRRSTIPVSGNAQDSFEKSGGLKSSASQPVETSN